MKIIEHNTIINRSEVFLIEDILIKKKWVIKADFLDDELASDIEIANFGELELQGKSYMDKLEKFIHEKLATVES
ncbi:MAG: hypothetical protein ACI9AT_000428 [Ulvibacter sp.]|jgi:hypothetical protein